MSTVSSPGRRRPEPIRIDAPSLGARSLRTRMAFKSPVWASSPLSPMSRPPPLYPDSGKEEQMNEHDRSAVDRLETRTPGPEQSLKGVSLRPIAELSLPTPRSASLHLRPPLSAPLLPPPQFRRPTIAEETRHMLLFEPDAEKGITPEISKRRQSAPHPELLARAAALRRHRQFVRHRGSVSVFTPREPDLMVIPIELRRPSTLNTLTPEGGLPTPADQDKHRTIRVIVHSRGHKPVVLTRKFDVEELRATIADASPSPPNHASRRASLAILQPPIRISRPASPAFLNERRHSSGAIHPSEPSRPTVAERRNPRQESHSVPIHLVYARTHLPILAAIILSPIIHRGDTIELPLPHPRAWKATVSYIYTGRAELTEPIKQNILYLGGQV